MRLHFRTQTADLARAPNGEDQSKQRGGEDCRTNLIHRFVREHPSCHPIGSGIEAKAGGKIVVPQFGTLIRGEGEFARLTIKAVKKDAISGPVQSIASKQLAV